MKTVGIVSEYNPFHKGHQYHIEAAKEACHAEAAVCIMSGSFVQRGEPSMFDKWSRAEMAVSNGADLVLELPFVYACQPAEIFALGAVKILNATGIINHLCFGSELGDIQYLYRIAELLSDEPKEFKQLLKKELEKGATYAHSISKAIEAYAGITNETQQWEEILKTPNNVLGIEYIKALKKLKSSIEPVTVKRIENNYNDADIAHSIASATAIRNEIKNFGLSDKALQSLPPKSYEIIKKLINIDKGPVFLQNFSDLILYKLRSISVEELNSFLNVREGLENRLKKQAAVSSDSEELISNLKTKRYTRTYLQRLLFHILLDLKREDIFSFKDINNPVYFRVLSFNDKGKFLLKQMKDSSVYPIITKAADYKASTTILDTMFRYDCMSTDIYNLGFKNNIYKKAGEDFYTSPSYI